MTDLPPSSTPAPGQPDWDTLARFVAGESPDAEAEAVRHYLAAHPEGAELLSVLSAGVGRLEARAPADLDVDAALREIHRRMHEPAVVPLRRPQADAASPSRQSTWRARFIGAAAAVAILAVGMRVVWSTRAAQVAAPQASARIFATTVGQLDSTRLPDGTRVVLGPRSELTVSAAFGLRAREVILQGDAFFDVVHDAAHPFVVRSGNAIIADVGTSFAVHSDPGDGVRVSVTTGAVRLRAASTADAEAVELRAGDLGTLEPAGPAAARVGGATADDLAWTRGRLVFREAPIAKVRADLKRWYGVELIVNDSSLNRRHVTASFSGESVVEVVRVIALALGAREDVRADTVFIRPAGSPGRRTK